MSGIFEGEGVLKKFGFGVGRGGDGFRESVAMSAIFVFGFRDDD